MSKTFRNKILTNEAGMNGNTDFCIDITKSKLQEKEKFDKVVQSHIERARLSDY